MNRITELQNLISRASQIYYNGGESTVSDAVFDGWVRELKELDPSNSLLKRIGAPIPANSALQKVQHEHHMGSLNNAMNEEEFLAWHKKMTSGLGDPLYNVSYKMDGCSVELVYKDGELVQASTRGDGEIGEDVTANALRMQGVPRFVMTPASFNARVHELPETDKEIARREMSGIMQTPAYVYIPTEAKPFNGFARGEVMLFNDEWKQLDPEQTSNPRNLGNGINRRKDGQDSEYLRFVMFRLFDEDGEALGNTESEMLKIATDMGFQTVQYWDRVTAKDVIKMHLAMQGDKAADFQIPNRDQLPFEIDGLVVKVESFDIQNNMGESDNRPKAQIAFKFPAKSTTTIIESVEWSVGHTGTLIPTANLKPVQVGGVTVARALLCNMEEIARLGVGIGDEVEVKRAGDVIPKIVAKVGNQPNVVPITAPDKCPGCGGVVGKRKGTKGDEGVHLFCLNPNCSSQQLGKLKTWVAKLDIQGLGDVFLGELYDRNIVKTPTALYTVSFANLAKVLGEPRAEKVVNEINKKRNLSLSDFLGSLGIEGLGRRRVQLVQQALPGQFDTLEDWTSGKLVKLASQVGLPGSAETIFTKLTESNHLIVDLLSSGVTIIKQTEKPKPMETQNLNALTFVLTGKFDKPKAFYHDAITAAGHRFEETYKKGISYLVASDPGSNSSKMKKAEKDGVAVISDVKLMVMLRNS